MNLGACPKLARTPETGTWYRAVKLAHLKTPINTAHTKASPSRFSAGPAVSKPFEILYLTETSQVAMFETGALLGDPLLIGGAFTLPGSFAVVHVKVVLQKLVDLTLSSQQSLIETTAQELTGDWRGYQQRTAAGATVREPVGTAPTQDLGEALFGVKGIEGFRTLSAKLPYHRNLIVFPQKLFKGSRLEFSEPSTGILQVIDGKVPRTPRRGWVP